MDIAWKVAKLLNTQNIGHEMLALGIPLKCVRIDCITRWSSTYTMVNIFCFD